MGQSLFGGYVDYTICEYKKHRPESDGRCFSIYVVFFIDYLFFALRTAHRHQHHSTGEQQEADPCPGNAAIAGFRPGERNGGILNFLKFLHRCDRRHQRGGSGGIRQRNGGIFNLFLFNSGGLSGSRSGLSGGRSGLSGGRGGLSSSRSGLSGGRGGLSGSHSGLGGSRSGLGGSRSGLGGSRSGLSGGRSGLGGSRGGLSGGRGGLSGSRGGLSGGRSGLGSSRSGLSGSRGGLSSSRSGLGDSRSGLSGGRSGLSSSRSGLSGSRGTHTEDKMTDLIRRDEHIELSIHQPGAIGTDILLPRYLKCSAIEMDGGNGHLF